MPAPPRRCAPRHPAAAAALLAPLFLALLLAALPPRAGGPRADNADAGPPLVEGNAAGAAASAPLSPLGLLAKPSAALLPRLPMQRALSAPREDAAMPPPASALPVLASAVQLPRTAARRLSDADIEASFQRVLAAAGAKAVIVTSVAWPSPVARPAPPPVPGDLGWFQRRELQTRPGFMPEPADYYYDGQGGWSAYQDRYADNTYATVKQWWCDHGGPMLSASDFNTFVESNPGSSPNEKFTDWPHQAAQDGLFDYQDYYMHVFLNPGLWKGNPLPLPNCLSPSASATVSSSATVSAMPARARHSLNQPYLFSMLSGSPI